MPGTVRHNLTLADAYEEIVVFLFQLSQIPTARCGGEARHGHGVTKFIALVLARRITVR